MGNICAKGYYKDATATRKLFAGGVLMTLFVLEHLLIRLSGRKVEAAPDAQDILMTEA